MVDITPALILRMPHLGSGFLQHLVPQILAVVVVVVGGVVMPQMVVPVSLF